MKDDFEFYRKRKESASKIGFYSLKADKLIKSYHDVVILRGNIPGWVLKFKDSQDVIKKVLLLDTYINRYIATISAPVQYLLTNVNVNVIDIPDEIHSDLDHVYGECIKIHDEIWEIIDSHKRKEIDDLWRSPKMPPFPKDDEIVSVRETIIKQLSECEGSLSSDPNFYRDK